MAMQLSPGKYVGKIKSQLISTSKSNNNPQIVFEVEIIGEVDSDNPGELIEVPGNKVRSIFETITDNTKKRVVETLKLIGYTGKSFRFLDKDSCSADEYVSLEGIEVPLSCEENNYEGKQSERWRFGFEGLGGLNVKRAGRSEVEKLDAMFGDAFEDEGEKENAYATPPKKDAATPNKPTGRKKESVPF